MTHRLNKQKFQQSMERRGWIMDAPTHSWIRPNGLTQATAEQDWIDAILEAVECEQPQEIQDGIQFEKSDSPVATLALHWLFEMRCDSTAKTDTAFCSCGLWNSGPQPSVGAAARKWAAHALEIQLTTKLSSGTSK